MEWTCDAEKAPWPPRSRFAVAVFPTGVVLITGGVVGPKRDIWRWRPDGSPGGGSPGGSGSPGSFGGGSPGASVGVSGWERLSSEVPWRARYGHSAVALPDGAALVMGGMSGAGDLLGDTWQSQDEGVTWSRCGTEAPSWTARIGHRAVVLAGGEVLLMGGLTSSSDSSALRDVWRSPDRGSSWELVVEEADWAARSWFGLAVLPDGSVCVLGGMGTDSGPLSDVWRSEDRGKTWTCILAEAPWPARRGHAVAVLPRGDFLLLGGIGSSDVGSSILLGDVWRSLDRGSTWEQIAQNGILPPRVDPGIAVLPGGTVLVLGGQSAVGGDFCNDVWRLAMPGGASARDCTPCSASTWQWQVEEEASPANEVPATKLPRLLLEKRPAGQVHEENAAHPPFGACKVLSLDQGRRSGKWRNELQKLRVASEDTTEAPDGSFGTMSPASQLAKEVDKMDVLECEDDELVGCVSLGCVKSAPF